MATNTKWTWKVPASFWKGMGIGSIATIAFVFVRAAYINSKNKPDEG